MGKEIPSLERPRGGNYLNDYHPEENQFYPIPKKHQEEYFKLQSEINRSLTFEELKKEMVYFKEKLHINAIRIAGHSIEDGLRTAVAARESKIIPWLSPRFWGATFEETKELFAKYVAQATTLGLENSPLIVGNEFTLECADDPITGEKSNLDGDEREHERAQKYLEKGVTIDCTSRVRELVKIARAKGWTGPITYAALDGEVVDWDSLEDDNIFAATNLYWGQNYKTGKQLTAAEYEEKLLTRKEAAGNRPFVLTEFGSVPQREGGSGNAYTFEGDLDYQAQAEAYRKYLEVLEKNNVGYFAFALDEPIKEAVGEEWAKKSYAIVLRNKEGSGPTLTPAGEVFAEHNRNYSQNVNGIEIDLD